MLDPEKLLKKMAFDMIKKTKKKKGYKGKKSKGIFDSITAELTSGKGLMTAIGLGVGAYELYKSKNKRPWNENNICEVRL